MGHGQKARIFTAGAQKVKKKAWLTVAGGWWPEELRDTFWHRVREEGLNDRVEILGMVGEERLKALYSEARVLIHPVIEAFGMSALEAAACGCPMVIPRGSGVAELFEEGKEGFFPQEGDAEAFAGYVEKLLDDESLALEMGKKAWLRAKDLNWQAHAQKLQEILHDELLEGGRKPF